MKKTLIILVKLLFGTMLTLLSFCWSHRDADGIYYAGPDPFTMAVVATLVGTGVQAYGAYEKGKSQEELYKYNAKVKEREEAQIRRASMEEQLIRRTEAKRLLATRETLYAKAGVMMEGSPMEAQLQVASDMAEDIARLSWQYDIAAQRAKSEATIERYKAKAAKRAMVIDVTTSLLGGGAKIGYMYWQKDILEKTGELVGKGT